MWRRRAHRLAISWPKRYLGASTFGRTTGPLRLARSGARSEPSPNSNNRDQVTTRVSWAQVYPSAKGPVMTKGTVKFYNDQKGYGFIQPDDGGKDVFVHATALERSGVNGLREGQKVSFDTQTDPRSGRVAVGRLEVA